MEDTDPHPGDCGGRREPPATSTLRGQGKLAVEAQTPLAKVQMDSFVLGNQACDTLIIVRTVTPRYSFLTRTLGSGFPGIAAL